MHAICIKKNLYRSQLGRVSAGIFLVRSFPKERQEVVLLVAGFCVPSVA